MAPTKHFPARVRRIAGAVSLAYITALLLCTHWPTLPSIGPENTDKALHFLAYAGLAFFLSLTIFWSRKVRWWHFTLMFIAVAVFGGCDELTQPPFGRTADWFDWCADLCGAIVGISLGALANWWLRQTLAQKASQENQ